MGLRRIFNWRKWFGLPTQVVKTVSYVHNTSGDEIHSCLWSDESWSIIYPSGVQIWHDPHTQETRMILPGASNSLMVYENVDVLINRLLMECFPSIPGGPPSAA